MKRKLLKMLVIARQYANTERVEKLLMKVFTVVTILWLIDVLLIIGGVIIK